MAAGVLGVLLLLSFFSCLEPSLADISHRRSVRDDEISLGEDQFISELDGHLRLARAAGQPTKTYFTFQDRNNYAGILYSGNDSRVVFVLTYTRNNNGPITSTNLYRSDNYGANFTNINNRLESSGTIFLYPVIRVSPENYRNIIIPHLTQSVIYISNDEGVTFNKTTFTPSTINPRSLVYHPTKEQWFLAHDPSTNMLYVSTNLGTSLTTVSANVNSTHEYQWGTPPYDTDDTTFYYNTDNPNDLTSEVHLYKQSYPYTSSTRVEFDAGFGPHDDFLMLDRYIFAQKTVNGVIQLYVSYDRKPFQLAHIPSTLPHQNYIVDSLKARQALVIIQHTNGQFNLYLSEETGLYFSLSLPNIVIESGVIDLELVDSMNDTTYICNQYIVTSGSSSSSKRTLISFDAGGNWEMLRPPTADVNGQVIQCILPNCSLHLHMRSTEFWRTGVYSRSSAPGIIIAHGITGAVLNSNNVNLYISRDGGVSWNMTLSSTWGVSVLDYGGLIVAAQDYHQFTSVPSKTLKYSCNEGRSWSSYTFAAVNTVVFGVITEPGEATTVVSLYGLSSGVSGWVVATVNFTNIFPSICANSDYYTWSPYDENLETGCLLGAQVGIERRYPSHCCLSGKGYVREVTYTICPCDEDDFECDYGYQHANGISGPCIRNSSVSLPDQCTGGEQTYLKSQGYRKIGGDVCAGGLESQYARVETSCCSSGGNTTTVTTTVTVTGSMVTSSCAVVTVDFPVTRMTTVTVVVPAPTVTSMTTVTVVVPAPPVTSMTTVTVVVPAPPVTSMATVTVVVPAGTPAPVVSDSGTGDRTIAVILGVVLLIALFTLSVIFIILVAFVMKVYRKSSNGRYTRVPAYNERVVMGNIQDQISLINSEGDDDDEPPLPL